MIHYDWSIWILWSKYCKPYQFEDTFFFISFQCFKNCQYKTPPYSLEHILICFHHSLLFILTSWRKESCFQNIREPPIVLNEAQVMRVVPLPKNHQSFTVIQKKHFWNAGPWSSPLYRPRCHWPHGIPLKTKQKNGWQWLTYSRSATLYKSLRKGNFLFQSFFFRIPEGRKAWYFEQRRTLWIWRRPRKIFTTPIAIIGNRWFAWRRRRKSPPDVSPHPIPTSPISTPIHCSSQVPKNPGCCAWKIKSPGQMCLNGSFLEFHSATRPSCHPPSSWTAWMSMDIMDGCHGQAATKFLEGNCQAVFWRVVPNKLYSCVFWGNGNIFVMDFFWARLTLVKPHNY